jgi:histidinol-phosphate aminotransferase
LRKKIKLHMNELPYMPPGEVMAAAQRGLMEINRYADPDDMESLREHLADYSEVSRDHIVPAPGSDFLLREIVQIFSKNRKVVIVEPSFIPTLKSAKQFASKLISIRLSSPDFELPHHLLIDQLNEPSLMIIDNPNNPTGKLLLDAKGVESILKNREVLFVIDEAYYEFSGVTFAGMIKEYPNLAVTRSMDKAFSLAGARIGYAIAGESFIRELSSFYIYLPQSSLYAAREALKNPQYVRENVGKIIAEKDRVFGKLKELEVEVYQTSTNFLLIKTDIPDVVRKFWDSGILISDLSRRISPGFIRVSLGSSGENDLFIEKYMEFSDMFDSPS